MSELVIKSEYKDIIQLLNTRRLKDALEKIEQYLYGVQEWKLHTLLEDITTSYEYMLKYMSEGSNDPERGKLYNQLITKAYYITDKARILKMTSISTEFYYDRLRYYKLIPLKSLPELQMLLESYTEDMAVGNLLIDDIKEEIKLTKARKNHEKAYAELFYRIWLSDNWSDTEEDEARDFLTSMLVQINDLSLFISAITLSLMEFFDVRKLMLLFDAYQHSSNEVNQRALVGLILTMYMYDERMVFYPEVAARLSLLKDNEGFLANLKRVQLQLLRSRETKKIDKKMREEIIPEMLKNPNITKRKFDIEDMDDDSSDDRNPDWEDWMEQSGLSDKLKEMSELQMEGADVYMSTFSQLKTYSFFHEMANWFYPFDTQHSSVVQAFTTMGKKRNILLDTILQSGFFCNSDKYSFCFTIAQIPKAQQEMMTQQFEAQNEALNEAKRYEKMIAYSQQAETISNQYIQDLYRFFKIHPRRHEFEDIFEESLNLLYTKTFKPLLNDPTTKSTLAGYFFHKDYFLEALLLYQEIVETDGGNVEIYQKIGYCYQKNKHYEKAVEAYLQADLLKADNVWTDKHLAYCYRQLKQYDNALLYYKKVESVQPENLSVLLQIGYCLVELKAYEEALAYFFKVEYLNNDSIKAWRAIGWCSFVTGKYEQAMKYYQKVLKRSPQLQDYLNTGHVAWTLGNIKEAVERYKTTLLMTKDTEVFLNLFNRDQEELIRQGIKEEEIPLMLDLVEGDIKE